MRNNVIFFLFLVLLHGASIAATTQTDNGQAREIASLLEEAAEQATISDSIDLKAYMNSRAVDQSPLQALRAVSQDAVERFVGSLKFSDTGLASYYSEDLDQLDQEQRLSILRLFGSSHVVTRASSDEYLNDFERNLKAAMDGFSQPLYTQYPDRTCLIVALRGGCAPQEGDWCSQLHCGDPIPDPGGPGDDEMR